MSARKLYQLCAVPLGDGIAIYARLDNGKIFYCFQKIGPYEREQSEWTELRLPPGVTPFDGNNGGPEY